MKFFVPVLSALLAGANADPEADSWLGYSSGYGSIGLGYGGYATSPIYRSYGGYGIWKRDAEAKPEAEAWGTYGYSGLGGLGYGSGYGYGTGYATGYSAAIPAVAAAPAVVARPAVAVVARPAVAVTHTAIPVTQTTHIPVAHTRTETVPVGVQTRVVSGGIVNGAAGIWKRDAEAEAWGTYGYGLGAGLGYAGAYTTGLTSIAAPVYGYSTPAYTTGYGYGRGIWKREADAESDPQSWYGNYGLAGGLGYGGYGGYATATIARPVYGYANLGYSGYGAGSYGLY